MTEKTGKLRTKAKSPLKFPKNNKKQPILNPYKSPDKTSWEIWREMCQLYEVKNSPHYDKYRDTLPKFRRRRDPVTYERPIQEIHNVSLDHNNESPNEKQMNNDTVEAPMASYLLPQYKEQSV